MTTCNEALSEEITDVNKVLDTLDPEQRTTIVKAFMALESERTFRGPLHAPEDFKASSSDTKIFSFSYVENTDKILKSHYIISDRSSADIGNTCKKASLQPTVNQLVVKPVLKGA